MPAVEPLTSALDTLSESADAGWRMRLLQLRSRVQGRWRPWPSAGADAAGQAAVSAAGHRLGLLWLGEDHALWQDGDGRVWRATLAPLPAAPAASR